MTSAATSPTGRESVPLVNGLSHYDDDDYLVDDVDEVDVTPFPLPPPPQPSEPYYNQKALGTYVGGPPFARPPSSSSCSSVPTRQTSVDSSTGGGMSPLPRVQPSPATRYPPPPPPPPLPLSDGSSSSVTLTNKGAPAASVLANGPGSSTVSVRGSGPTPASLSFSNGPVPPLPKEVSPGSATHSCSLLPRPEQQLHSILLLQQHQNRQLRASCAPPYPARSPAADSSYSNTKETSGGSSYPEVSPPHDDDDDGGSVCTTPEASIGYPPSLCNGKEVGGYPGSSFPGPARDGYPSGYGREGYLNDHLHRQQQPQKLHLQSAYRGSSSTTTICCKHGAVSDMVSVSASDYPLKRQRSTRSTRSTASRRRQNEDVCTTCLRGTLHCYNVCILIIGCAALGVGIWLLVTDFGARNVTPLVGSQLYEVTTYLLIAGGGAVALLAFCGCCGTIREDKCVLSFYGTTLAIVLIVLGVACGLAFFFRGVFSEQIQKRMMDSLTKQYGVDERTSVENRRVTESWDAMQRQLQCCGISGNTTSKMSWSFYSLSTEWNARETLKAERRKVPDSCCAKGDTHLCTGLKSFKGPPMFFNSHLHEYQMVNPYLYTTGCYDKLIDYLYTYSAVVGCVAAVVPLFLVLGIIVSFCLCARVAGISAEEEVEL